MQVRLEGGSERLRALRHQVAARDDVRGAGDEEDAEAEHERSSFDAARALLVCNKQSRKYMSMIANTCSTKFGVTEEELSFL